MAVLDAKKPAFQASTKAIAVTEAEAKTLEGKTPLAIDGGGALALKTRILLKNQLEAEQNGLYEVSRNEGFGCEGTFGGPGKFGVGSGWTLTRTADADSSEEVKDGMLVPIEDGETNRQASWILRAEGPVEVGTDPQEFEPLLAGARGVAGGDLSGTYSKPSLGSGTVGNAVVKTAAGISYSKLDLAGKISASDLAASAQELSPQLAVAGKKKVSSGSIEVEWAGATQFSSKLKVSHSLGSTPGSIVATGRVTNPGSFVPVVFTFTPTETEFEIQAYAPQGNPPAGAKSVLSWEASS